MTHMIYDKLSFYLYYVNVAMIKYIDRDFWVYFIGGVESNTSKS